MSFLSDGKIFSLYFVFCGFNIIWLGILYYIVFFLGVNIYPALWISGLVLSLILYVFGYSYFKYFFCPFSLSSYSGIPMTHMSEYLVLFYRFRYASPCAQLLNMCFYLANFYWSTFKFYDFFVMLGLLITLNCSSHLFCYGLDFLHFTWWFLTVSLRIF